MVFLVCQMRTLSKLRRFKVVVVTDRTDLEKGLAETAALIGEPMKRAANSEDLKAILREEGADLVFAMIQKVQEREGDELYPELNDSEHILLLVDEAHRAQSSTLHANLRRALPNAAKIGFTGAPIMIKDRKPTEEIFSPFIDRYTIEQSEEDGSTVPILYEGRTTDAAVADGRSLDELFEDMFRDMLRHYIQRRSKRLTQSTVSAVLEETQEATPFEDGVAAGRSLTYSSRSFSKKLLRALVVGLRRPSAPLPRSQRHSALGYSLRYRLTEERHTPKRGAAADLDIAPSTARTILLRRSSE